jgi:hypothetical protein
LAEASRLPQVFLTGLYLLSLEKSSPTSGVSGWTALFSEEKTHGLDEAFIRSFYKYGKRTTKVQETFQEKAI